MRLDLQEVFGSLQQLNRAPAISQPDIGRNVVSVIGAGKGDDDFVSALEKTCFKTAGQNSALLYSFFPPLSDRKPVDINLVD
ncbi:MAG: hypothetical protein AB1545_04900 [Thermodesulfobacteriota bacterium]